jgi:hypothetical protein
MRRARTQAVEGRRHDPLPGSRVRRAPSPGPWRPPYLSTPIAGGAVASTARAGKGEFILIATPWMLSNEGIGLADNFVFVTELIRHTGATTVWFDEYHHGYTSHRGGWISLLSPGARTALIHVCVAMLILVLVGTRRLGRPVHIPPAPRVRTEYLSSLSELLYAAKSTDVAAKMLLSQYETRIRRALRAPAGTSDATLLNMAGERSDELRRDIGEALGGGARLVSAGRPPVAEVLRWAQSTAQLCERLERSAYERSSAGSSHWQ